MAARTTKIRHDENTRLKIQVSQLINRLQDHVLGTAQMTQTQLRAAEVLLRKALPDLSSTDITFNDDREITAFSDAELTAMLRATAARAKLDEAPRSETEALN